MRFLVLRFDAPLMSFGGPVVDNRGITVAHPGRSMLTGLLGNALGWDHVDVDRLNALQERLVVAARADRPGDRLTDYQTVDLGQPHLAVPGWTTRGAAETRAGAFSDGTHIRHRDYVVDAAYTVLVGLSSPGDPTLDALAEAVARPARPLFLGRKSCLPARPLVDPRRPIVEGKDAVEAFRRIPLLPSEVERGEQVDLWVPSVDAEDDLHGEEVHDARDWRTQLHVGSHRVRRERWERAEFPPEST